MSSSSSDNDSGDDFHDNHENQNNGEIDNNDNKSLVIQRREEKSIPSSSKDSQLNKNDNDSNNKDQKINQLQNQVQQMMIMLQQQQSQKQKKKQKKQQKKQKFSSSFIPVEPEYNITMFSPQPSQQPTFSKNNSGTDTKQRSAKMKLIPPKPKVTSSSRFFGCFKIFLVLIIISALIFILGTNSITLTSTSIVDFFNNLVKSPEPVKIRVVTEMTDVFPSPECIKIGKRQLKRMRGNVDEWVNLDHSLYHHLIGKRLGVISAFRIGLPYCYTLMRMPGNATLRMLNPEIVAFSIDKVTSPKEKPYNCMDIARWVKRSDDITVIYNDPVLMDRKLLRLTNQTAWAFQHEYIYNHSFDICKGEDKGVDILQDMFFADKQKNLKKLNQ